MAQFDDKVVWITGGGTGIGAAMAREFARRGAAVAVSGRRADRLEAVVSEIVASGGRAIAVPCDVTDEESLRRAVETVVAQLWKIDVAIANAGFSVVGRIEKLSADEWRRQLDTNVVGAALTAKAALPELRKTDGRLALVASVAGLVCSPGVGAYHASKFAVRAIGLTLSMELAGTGVTCTTIHPGFVESEIAQVDNAGRFDSERQDRRPAKLMWKADDAARDIVQAIWRRKREAVITGHGKVAGFFGQHAPGLVQLAVTRSGGGYKRRDDA